MSNAKYIGRVGGLAVALGVGMAVATTPGVAWADDTGSAGSGTPPGRSGTGTAGAAGTGGTSEPATTTGTTTGATGTSTAGGSQTDGASAPGSGAVDASQSRTSASTDASVRQVPPGMVLATGGDDSWSKSSSETPATADVGAESTPDDSTPPKRVADSTATGPRRRPPRRRPCGPRGGSDKKPRPVDEPTGAPGVDAGAVTATAGAAPSRPQPSDPARTVVDVAVHQPAAPQAVTAAARAPSPRRRPVSLPAKPSRLPPRNRRPLVPAERGGVGCVGVVGSAGHQRSDDTGRLAGGVGVDGRGGSPPVRAGGGRGNSGPRLVAPR